METAYTFTANWDGPQTINNRTNDKRNAERSNTEEHSIGDDDNQTNLIYLSQIFYKLESNIYKKNTYIQNIVPLTK